MTDIIAGPAVGVPRPAEAPINAVLAPSKCVSCGSLVNDRFCPNCGEQRAEARHYTLGHFAEEAIEALAHADGRVLSALRTLVTKPGLLTVAYMRGERKPFAAPLQLFVVANVAYFLFAAWTGNNTFGTPLQFHVNGAFYSGLANTLVRARLASRHISYDQYAAVFDHAAMLQAKSLIALLCPIFAVWTAAVLLPRRRFAVEYLVFAVHSMSAMLFIVIVVQLMGRALLAVAAMEGVHPRWQPVDIAVTLVMVFLFGAYIHASLRRVYGIRGASAAVRVLLMCVGFMVTIFVYRSILFFTTFVAT